MRRGVFLNIDDEDSAPNLNLEFERDSQEDLQLLSNRIKSSSRILPNSVPFSCKAASILKASEKALGELDPRFLDSPEQLEKLSK